MEKREIGKETYDCPFCRTNHVVSEREYEAVASIKNTEVAYKKRACYCGVRKREFVPEILAEKNAQEVRESYRRRMGLLTAGDIKAIRDMYGVTQKEYARLLGVGDATIQRYEAKAIQDATYDMIMRATRDNPAYCLKMLEQNRGAFDGARYAKLRNAVIGQINENGQNYFAEQMIRMQYAQFDSPTEANGYRCLDIEKTKQILLYLAEKIGYLYKPKAMKLLWYIDALSCKKYGKAVTGLVYRRKTFGVLPVAHHEFLGLAGIKVTEKEHDDYTAYRIEAGSPSQKGAFTEEETDMINEVLHRFSTYNTKEIAQYMRDEVAYKETADNEVIRFCQTHTIRDF